MKLGKMFFILFQKLFSFSRKSMFRNLDIQISWRHEVPKHKTRNTFYWITWEVNSLLIKFGQLMPYSKQKNFDETCKMKNNSRLFFVCKELSTNSIGKWNFWSNYIRYVIARVSKFVQTTWRLTQIPFYRGIFGNKKRPGTSFQVIFFI